MLRFSVLGVAVGVIFGGALPLLAGSVSAQPVIKAPVFHSQFGAAWMEVGDEFLPPPSGAGPVTNGPRYPYIDNGRARRERKQPTYRVADLSNPILQPWGKEQMKKANDEVLAGKVPFRPRERCYPGGVPGFVVYTLVTPFFFIQTDKHVTIVNEGGPEIRRVYLNVPHSANPKPSWYGESVGHYEHGDTLVVDTIGVTTKAFVDNYRTPHTDALHVVERFKMLDGGAKLEVLITVEDQSLHHPMVRRSALQSRPGAPIVRDTLRRKQFRPLQFRRCPATRRQFPRFFECCAADGEKAQPPSHLGWAARLTILRD